MWRPGPDESSGLHFADVGDDVKERGAALRPPCCSLRQRKWGAVRVLRAALRPVMYPRPAMEERYKLNGPQTRRSRIITAEPPSGKLENSADQALLDPAPTSLWPIHPALPSLACHQRRIPEDVFKYTARETWVSIITSGTAVLGLGNIGPLAGKPVMEEVGCSSSALPTLMPLTSNSRPKTPTCSYRACACLSRVSGHQPLEHQSA